MKRAFVVVIDACGVGAAADAAEYGDAGTNTLAHLAEHLGGLELPALQELGLGSILPLSGLPPAEAPVVHGRLDPLGPGKDSTAGHWGLMGVASVRRPPTYPDGLDVEVVSEKALLDAAVTAQLPSEREHVTLFIRNHPERFNIGRLTQSMDLSSHRWTVDDPEDLDLIQRIYEALYPANVAFTTADILALLQSNPELMAINSHLERDAGLRKSLLDESRLQRKGS